METCANCGTELTGPYCSQCGQEHLAGIPTFRQVFQDAWEEIVKVDGRVLATLKSMFTKPGQLTFEFFEGRRVRFVTPLRLYLSCSAFYFLISSFGDIKSRIEQQAVVQATSTSAETQLLMTKILHDGTRLFFDHLSTIYIVLVPLTALASALLFRSRKRSLLFHLVFVLHIWSALFLIVGGLAAILASLHLSINFFQLFLVVGFVYTIPAAMRTFKAKPVEATVKAGLFSLSTSVLSVLALVAIMASIAFQKSTQLEQSPSGAEENVRASATAQPQ